MLQSVTFVLYFLCASVMVCYGAAGTESGWLQLQCTVLVQVIRSTFKY